MRYGFFLVIHFNLILSHVQENILNYEFSVFIYDSNTHSFLKYLSIILTYT